MEFTMLSHRNRVTISEDVVHELGLVPGMKLKQWVEGNRLIMEPVPDIMDSFGSLSKPEGMPFLSPREESDAMELAVVREVTGLARDGAPASCLLVNCQMASEE